MNNLFNPLTKIELDFLEALLLDRIDEDDNTEGQDEGVLDVSSLDGLFAALVSGPATIAPSKWLPLVWGDYEPVWANKDDFMTTFSLFTRHMNSIIAELTTSPQSYQPIFLGRTIEDKEIILVDDWCYGYVRGMDFIYTDLPIDNELNILLTPIIAFGTDLGWDKLKQYNEQERENIRNSITPNSREIFTYWADKRGLETTAGTISTMQHKQPKVSRNDSCPCGSGKKFKKCCLH